MAPDRTISLEREYMDGKVITVADYIRCFGALPPSGATFEVSILSDIPVNGDPSQMFSWETGSPGHSFIQLRQVANGQSIQQNIGFYLGDLSSFKYELLADIKKLLGAAAAPGKRWLKSVEVRKLLGVSANTLTNMRINGHYLLRK